MRRILLASAALLTIALAAPLAGAQYPDSAQTPPATTQAPNPDQQSTPTAPETQTPAMSEPSTTETAPPTEAQTNPDATTAPDAYAETPAQTETPNAGAAAEAYAQNAPSSGASIDLSDEASMAGMHGVAMSAHDVCQPRSVSLTQGGSRLNHDARRHLINATDVASVCKLQRVVIHSPSGRADAARQTMAQLGVDESLIEVERGEGGLGVDMTFNGVAASSEEYAAMYNGVQTASAEPTQAAPGAAPAAPTEETGAYQPTAYQQPDTNSAQQSDSMSTPEPAQEPMPASHY